jgi:Domain of unknown function (DUF6946)/HD domain
MKPHPGTESESAGVVTPAGLSRQYSAGFDRALALASIAHNGVCRKGTTIPYILHPVHVARLLERHGFSEDVVLAGLLHDVLEDGEFGDAPLQAALRATFSDHFGSTPRTESGFRAAFEAFIAVSFGETVLKLVNDVTKRERHDAGKRSWREGRQEQIDHIAQLDTDGAGLKAADVLHNSQAILRDVRELGLEALTRFKNCSTEELLWWYGTVTETLRERLRKHSIMRELDDAVFELTEEINGRLARPVAPAPCLFCQTDHQDTGACGSYAGKWPVVMTIDGARIRSLAHWRRVAPPVGRDRHWVPGRSAKEAARAWSQLDAPKEVLLAVRALPGLDGFTAATVIPELVTSLDDFGEGRNHDLIVLGTAGGKRVLVGIEAKSDEELGPRIGDYLANVEERNEERRSAGQRLSNIPERIRLLTRLLFGERVVDLSEQRYQLLHGIGGTLTEAANRCADVAVFMVHTFRSPRTDRQRIERNKKDIEQFVSLLRSADDAPEASAFTVDNSSGAARLPFFVTTCETGNRPS